MASSSANATNAGAVHNVKAHLLASQRLLVESLYNLAPLLDCMLAAGLLSQENYYEVRAEGTPPNRARKLLDVVHSQMDESDATRFVDCLRRCKSHYPRLRNWLCPEIDIQRGPTERRLQAQFSVLCARLGFSALPVSLALFSEDVLTQFELEQIQAALTQYQQAQILLSTCLSKGETTCRRFYEALNTEDKHLADKMSEEAQQALSVDSKPEVRSVHVAVEETGGSGDQSVLNSGLLQQVMADLGMAAGGDDRFNVCELGVVLGLPGMTVRECLLEGVGIGDAAQLRALVFLFMDKTQDEERLLNRVAKLNAQRVQLSERGCLLLKLLKDAEALLCNRDNLHSADQLCNGDHLHSKHHLQAEPHLHVEDNLHLESHLHPEAHLHDGDYLHSKAHIDQDTVWTIFRFLMWDCMAELLEEPQAGPSSDIISILQRLRASKRVDVALLQELEQCWEEGGADSTLQSVRVLAQVLRDLHPLEDGLCLSQCQEGVYTCHPFRLHRVTSFQGLPRRVIRKALRKMGHKSLNGNATPQATQYREVCVSIARLLSELQPEGGAVDLLEASDAAVVQHIHSTLSGFSAEMFDAGVRHRLLSVLEFNPVHLGLGSLEQLHQEALYGLECYLRPGEHHNFQFVLESVRILGEAQLLLARSVRGVVAIDNGMEEVFCFVTSEPTSFLVQLRGHGHQGGGGFFEVCEPHCVCVTQLRDEDMSELERATDVTILAEASGTVWLREKGYAWREKLEQRGQSHSAPFKDEGCCFRVTTLRSECEVKFTYKSKRIWALPQRYCEVL